jgi:hypothetical protein
VGTKLIVVIEHTSGVAVKGAIDRAKLGNLTRLLETIHAAVAAVGCGSSQDEACVTKVAAMNVRTSPTRSSIAAWIGRFTERVDKNPFECRTDPQHFSRIDTRLFKVWCNGVSQSGMS